MEKLGKVQEWNDDRGFGFILAIGEAAQAERIFFHIRAYDLQGRRPERGELVKYVAEKQADGKWKAHRVRRATAAATTKVAAPKRARPIEFRIPAWAQFVLIFAYGLVVFHCIDREKLPLEASFVIVTICIVTYIAYALDKYAAQKNAWRIPEANLHLLELAGGWPGALVAQQVLRHKTSKRSYRIAFWTMAGLHVAILLLWTQWR